MRERWRGVRTERWADRQREESSLSLPFFHWSPPRFRNDFRTGTIKHHSGNYRENPGNRNEGGGCSGQDLDCFSRERSWRGDAALLPPGPLGLLLLSEMLLQQYGCCLYPGSCKQKQVQAECRRVKVKDCFQREGWDLYNWRTGGVMPNRNRNREQPYALRDHILIPGESTAHWLSWLFSSLWSDFTPPSSSLRINQRGGPSACPSFCPSICCPFDCSNPRWEAWPDCVCPACPLQLIETLWVRPSHGICICVCVRAYVCKFKGVCVSICFSLTIMLVICLCCD